MLSIKSDVMRQAKKYRLQLNKDFPKFHNYYESYAVLTDYFNNAQHKRSTALLKMKQLWKSISFLDGNISDKETEEHLKNIKSILLADAECITETLAVVIKTLEDIRKE